MFDKIVALHVAQPGRGTRRDKHPDAALDDDKAFVLKSLIGLGDSERIGALFGSKCPDRRQGVAIGKLTRQDPVCDYFPEANVNRLFVGGTKRHGVTIQQSAGSSSCWI